ncbi:MAG: chloride channel protein [Bacteroidetes bacterium]|nr:chloride channel protein [Bacteroidota bacterium]
MNKILHPVERTIEWFHNKLAKKQFLILSSIFVGLSAGFAAVLLKWLVHLFHLAVTHDFGFKYQYLFSLVTPLIGILLTVFFVTKFLKGKLGRGNSNILFSIAKKSSNLPKDQMYSHIVSSALTVGFGGSAGLESPIVTTGAAIGSNFGKTYQLTYKDRTLLLACGAAAGIAAAFSAPVAGLLFAMEVLIVDVSISAFIPLMIAAATGALCSKIILGDDILLSFKLQQAFDYRNIPWYILLGALSGLFCVFYARVFPKVESFFRKKKKYPWRSAIIGGIVLGILIWLFPTLFGEGYDSIKNLADGQYGLLVRHSFFESFITSPLALLIFIAAIMLVKVFAVAATIGGGGNGGNFAPSLFAGGYLGFVFAKGIELTGISSMPIANFTIVGMAGVLAGIFYAPLTGIFLIAEITGGYELMIPLMIVSALSFSIVKYFEPYSMDTKKMAKKGHIFTQDRDRNILSTLKVRKIIETGFQTILPTMSLGELVETVSKSQRNIFPVIDEEGKLVGIITLDRIREIMFRHDQYNKVTVAQLMIPPAAIIQPEDDMYAVMKKFDETGAWNLPVVENEMYVGFVSKSSIFTKYRSQLIRSTAE